MATTRRADPASRSPRACTTQHTDIYLGAAQLLRLSGVVCVCVCVLRPPFVVKNLPSSRPHATSRNGVARIATFHPRAAGDGLRTLASAVLRGLQRLRWRGPRTGLEGCGRGAALPTSRLSRCCKDLVASVLSPRRRTPTRLKRLKDFKRKKSSIRAILQRCVSS